MTKDYGEVLNYKNYTFNYKDTEIFNKATGEKQIRGAVDKETFLNDNKNANESIFNQLDINKDGYITEREIALLYDMDKNDNGVVTNEERHQAALKAAIYQTERNVEKWFSQDCDANTQINKVEEERWKLFGSSKDKIGDLSNEEFAQKYKISDTSISNDTIIDWNKYWQQEILSSIKEQYGVDLSNEEDIAKLDERAKEQLNRWLFKGGAQADERSLYNRLTDDAYTRLSTRKQEDSCCGGSVDLPPIGDGSTCSHLFSALEGEPNAKNTANEVKNRLAWAIFDTYTKNELSQLSPFERARYKKDWEDLRSMTADDFRTLMNPENSQARKRFEEKHLMTVKQIVDYINIVEETTGESFESEGWSINPLDFSEILEKINGTYGDEVILQDKTYEDILPERQELYNYLKENNLLMDKFQAP